MFKIHPFYFNASEIFENSNRISSYFVTSNSSWTVFLSAMVQSHFNEIIVWCPSPGWGSGASFSINYLNWIYIFIKSTIQGIEQSMFILGIMKILAAKSAGIKNQLFVLFLISNLTEITVTHIALWTVYKYNNNVRCTMHLRLFKPLEIVEYFDNSYLYLLNPAYI